MTDWQLTAARQGEVHAFRQLTDPYRRELQLHCYRMLGSVQDSEDLLQETMLAAWRGLAAFEERASVRTWLYRIATNRCLNALRDASRRLPPRGPDPPFVPPKPTRLGEPTRLEPYPDELLAGIADKAPGPAARYEAREAIELAFIAGLLALPPRQRAALVLADVLGFQLPALAGMLGCSVPAAKGALQRARATLRREPPRRGQAPEPLSAAERSLARRFADAFAADDVEAVVELLTPDARLTMPPSPLEYQGHAAVASFLRASAQWRGGRRFRLVPTRANTQPAFGLYIAPQRIASQRAAARGPATTQQTMPGHPAGLIVLSLAGDRIGAITRFLEPGITARFALPATTGAGAG